MRLPPMTLAEAARVYRIPLGTLRRLVAENVIPSLTGRRPHTVDPWSVEEWKTDNQAARRHRIKLALLDRMSNDQGQASRSIGDYSPDDQHKHGDACPEPGCSDEETP